ncbi:MAG: di-trans,poly-cis-decaprenylcistransferase [Flavobacteriaceae bacterium]|nr:di-trans,poly-cis-decaprenylcistransferase [Flavobacteriaceae bacterium]|tara:strand:+ start:1206 stop:1934 length:729 start_codon:yes stop_codon:yes gene_type:complete
MKKELLKYHIPNHVAIIMDGNGRWAKKIGKKRVFGHESGTRSVKDCIEGCIEIGIKNVTLYVFSMENWKRPKFEVNSLMKLLVNSLEAEKSNLMENRVKLNAIGNLNNLNKVCFNKLQEVIDQTSINDQLTLTLAVSYGSKQEIRRAIKKISYKVKNNLISYQKIDEKIINDHLYTRNLPPVDLLIRTGGEFRLSNFLLWQIAYAELYFTEILWPDFRKNDFFDAIFSFQKRERRFGKVKQE